MLIIGCGNRQRSDDGAGILVAERLRKIGIEADMCIGEAADLIEAWRGADDVIVVDAMVTGAPVGTVQSWDGRQPLASIRTTASTHCLGVAEAIELAHVLNSLPTRLRVYGIEGRRFEPGVEISPEVRRAVEEVVRRIITESSAPPESGRPNPHDTAFTESGRSPDSLRKHFGVDPLVDSGGHTLRRIGRLSPGLERGKACPQGQA